MCSDIVSPAYTGNGPMKSAVSIVVVFANFLSVLLLAVPSLLSTSQHVNGKHRT